MFCGLTLVWCACSAWAVCMDVERSRIISRIVVVGGVLLLVETIENASMQEREAPVHSACLKICTKPGSAPPIIRVRPEAGG